jgi:amino acid permease
VISLLGGFTVTILSFILPSYLHMQLVGKKEAGVYSSPWVWDLVLTVGGSLLCVLATSVTTGEFVKRLGSGSSTCA